MAESFSQFWRDVWVGAPTITVLAFATRGVLSFAYLWMLARLMGQRAIARLGLTDFMVAITVGSIMSETLGGSESSMVAVWVVTAIWVGGHIALSRWALQSRRVERWLRGEPLPLVRGGKVLETNLRKARISLQELIEQMRLRGISQLVDVEFATLENNGQVSVIPRKAKQPVSPADLGLAVAPERMPALVVDDGQVLEYVLDDLGYNRRWLERELEKQGVRDMSLVFAAQVDGRGRLYVDLREDTEELPRPEPGPQLLARLQKIAAELDTFALDTGDIGARRMFQRGARRLRGVMEATKGYLS